MRRARILRTPSISHLVAGIAVATMILVGLPGPPAEAARRPKLRCDVTPTTDIRLVADLTCENGFRGTLDGAPAITIDLGGHTLTVTNGTCMNFGGCGAVYGEAVVKNGTVVGDLKDVRRVSQVKVVGNVYLDETRSPAATPSTGSVLERSVVEGRVGLFGPYATVRQNTIRGGGPVGGGIQFLDSLRNLSQMQIIGNLIQDAPDAGISVFDSCGGCPGDISGVIADNTISGAGTDGIAVVGQLDSLGKIDITHNTIRFSGGDGILVDVTLRTAGGGLGPVTLSGNQVIRNGSHGIMVDWPVTTPGQGVVDGGGNRARRNNVGPPCTGAACN